MAMIRCLAAAAAASAASWLAVYKLLVSPACIHGQAMYDHRPASAACGAAHLRGGSDGQPLGQAQALLPAHIKEQPGERKRQAPAVRNMNSNAPALPPGWLKAQGARAARECDSCRFCTSSWRMHAAVHVYWARACGMAPSCADVAKRDPGAAA